MVELIGRGLEEMKRPGIFFVVVCLFMFFSLRG
jgi:hypothetical protein